MLLFSHHFSHGLKIIKEKLLEKNLVKVVLSEIKKKESRCKDFVQCQPNLKDQNRKFYPIFLEKF